MLAILLIMTGGAVLALYSMHPYLDEALVSKRAPARAFSPATTQDLFRLGSGASTYSRTSRSLRADTLAPTAPPYVYGEYVLGLRRAEYTAQVPSSSQPLAISNSGGRHSVLPIYGHEVYNGALQSFLISKRDLPP